MEDKSLEYAIKFLSLPKESQEKIIADATVLAAKIYDFLKEVLQCKN